ncbi:MAG: methyltransferase domain-containing protein [Clostridia bacterium]|nr:methyltransferase domain-containing protein [Clostridia bacterium]
MDQSISIKKEPLNRKGAFLYVSKHHAFGTDGLLLAHFANAKHKDSYVDLGTGCGIIPYVLLRDNRVDKAIGVDISEEAIFLAQKTAEERGLSHRFKAIKGDIKELPAEIGFGCHNLVTCNPPYFANGTGIKNPDGTEAVARHEVDCSLDDVLSAAFRLLNTSGRFCMCHRPDRLSEILSKMSAHKLEPKRIQLVCQRYSLPPFLVLVEGKKCSKTGLTVMPTLSLTESVDEMLKIYGDYKEGYNLY